MPSRFQLINLDSLAFSVKPETSKLIIPTIIELSVFGLYCPYMQKHTLTADKLLVDYWLIWLAPWNY
jgi:hypothetical protein